MALEAGELTCVLEYATNLKDSDWFGKQDPYCILTCGQQTFRTRTAVDGGKNPVWNQTFKFVVINDNDVTIVVKDEDVGRDDVIGTAHLQLARVRMHGNDAQEVPVITKKGKQHGVVHVKLKFMKSLAHAQRTYANCQPQPFQVVCSPPGYQPPGYQHPGYQPQPQYYGAPGPVGYPSPMPGAFGAPMPAYHPPAPYAPAPPAGYPAGPVWHPAAVGGYR